jgi:hypothetical protein
MKFLCIALAFALLASTVASAEVKVIVQGDTVSIDPSGFPPQMRAGYDLMMEKCNRCHTIERIVAAVQTGICPLSKTIFSKTSTRSVVTRMYLKPESNMTKSDARTIILFLNYLLDQKVTVVEKRD